MSNIALIAITNMDELNFEKVCRICLGEGSMMSLFKVSMYKKMMAIASVQVSISLLS